MNLRLLIDGIVRQTTVLIAQLSTASGVRAPLSHVADHTFTVEPGHPHEREVYELLGTTRRNVQTLWDKVSEYNREHPPSEERKARVSFYLGQSVELDEE